MQRKARSFALTIFACVLFEGQAMADSRHITPQHAEAFGALVAAYNAVAHAFGRVRRKVWGPKISPIAILSAPVSPEDLEAHFGGVVEREALPEAARKELAALQAESLNFSPLTYAMVAYPWGPGARAGTIKPLTGGRDTVPLSGVSIDPVTHDWTLEELNGEVARLDALRARLAERMDEIGLAEFGPHRLTRGQARAFGDVVTAHAATNRAFENLFRQFAGPTLHEIQIVDELGGSEKLRPAFEFLFDFDDLPERERGRKTRTNHIVAKLETLRPRRDALAAHGGRRRLFDLLAAFETFGPLRDAIAHRPWAQGARAGTLRLVADGDAAVTRDWTLEELTTEAVRLDALHGRLAELIRNLGLAEILVEDDA